MRLQPLIAPPACELHYSLEKKNKDSRFACSPYLPRVSLPESEDINLLRTCCAEMVSPKSMIALFALSALSAGALQSFTAEILLINW